MKTKNSPLDIGSSKSIILAILLITTTFFWSKQDVKADIPAVPPSVVSCLCATSASATCVSVNSALLYCDYLFPYTEYSSCNAAGNYTVNTAPSGYVGNASFAAGVTRSTFPNTTIPSGVNLTLGSDTGIPCIRAGNVSGTLHATGYTFDSVLQDNTCWVYPPSANFSCY